MHDDGALRDRRIAKSAGRRLGQHERIGIAAAIEPERRLIAHRIAEERIHLQTCGVGSGNAFAGERIERRLRLRRGKLVEPRDDRGIWIAGASVGQSARERKLISIGRGGAVVDASVCRVTRNVQIDMGRVIGERRREEGEIARHSGKRACNRIGGDYAPLARRIGTGARRDDDIRACKRRGARGDDTIIRCRRDPDIIGRSRCEGERTIDRQRRADRRSRYG